MVIADKDLWKYAIEDEYTWQMLKDIISVLKSFWKATDLVAQYKYIMIYVAILIYNFLLNILENNDKDIQIHIIKTEEPDTIHWAIMAAIDKLKIYYSITNTPIYYIDTNKLMFLL